MKRDVKNTNLITIGENGRGNVFMGVYITKKNNRKNTKVISKHRHGWWLFPLKASLTAVNIICRQ
jgi:hypothetical protein